MNSFICYERCGTCKKAEKWLLEKGVEFSKRAIKEENPSLVELTEWYQRSGLSLKRFFNTSGNAYKELGLKDRLSDMTEEEQLKLLAGDGMLVKRPLLITEKEVLVGFKEEEWSKVFGEK